MLWKIVLCLCSLTILHPAYGMLVFDEDATIQDLGGLALDKDEWDVRVVDSDEAGFTPPSGQRMIRLTGKASSAANSAVCRTIREIRYTITKNTVFSYYVRVPSTSVDDGLAIELRGDRDIYLRNVEPPIRDQNSLLSHPRSYKVPFDIDQWYYREFSLGALAGQTITEVAVAYDDVEEQHFGAFCGYFDVIRLEERAPVFSETFELPSAEARVLNVDIRGPATDQWVLEVQAGEQSYTVSGVGKSTWRRMLYSSDVSRKVHVTVRELGQKPRPDLRAEARLNELGPSEIHINVKDERQVMRGFGGQADFQLLGPLGKKDGVTEEDYKNVIQACLDNGYRWARVGAWNFEQENDDDDPEHYNWPAFREQLDRDNAGLVDHIRYLKSVGVEPLLVLWGSPAWMAGDDNEVSMAEMPEAVENAAALLKVLDERGAGVRYFTLVNEPGYYRKIHRPDVYMEAIRRLNQRLDALKLDVELVSIDLSAYLKQKTPEWIREMGERADPETNIICLHGYDFSIRHEPEDIPAFDEEVFRLLREHDTDGQIEELWYTEFNTLKFGNADHERQAENGPCDSWAHAIEIAKLTHYFVTSGVSNLMLWEAYDVRRMPNVEPKRWGTLKYITEGWAKRPSYFTFGSYARSIKPGYTIVGSRELRREQEAAPLVAAAKGQGHIVAVILNANPFSDHTRITGFPLEGNVRLWQTTEQAPFQALASQSGPELSIELPAQSITVAIHSTRHSE